MPMPVERSLSRESSNQITKSGHEYVRTTRKKNFACPGNIMVGAYNETCIV